MNKSFMLFSVACAFVSCAFADHGQNEQWQNPWFNAIGAQTDSTIVSTNGTWDLTNAGYEIANKKLVLEQKEDQVATFVIKDPSDYPVDTNTVVEIKSKVAFYPVYVSDLPSVADMTAAGNTIGFIVAKDAGELSYRVWIAGQSAWTKLEGLAAPTDAEVEVLVRINYRQSAMTSDTDARKVTFYVGGVKSTTSIDMPDGLTANPSGVKVEGCGTVASVDGEVQFNVASIGQVGYATIDEAVKHAPTGGDSTISVDRKTDESVDLAGQSGVKISDNGNMTGTVMVPEGQQLDVVVDTATVGDGASGTYTVPVKAAGIGTIVLDLPTSVTTYKEVREQTKVSGGIQVTLQTRGDILTNAASTAQCAILDVNDNLRQFLLRNASNEYCEAECTAAKIGAKLAETPTDNENRLKLWQDYVIGIEPSDSVAPVASAGGLAIPTIDKSRYSGDYTISYQAGTASSTDDPMAIPIPHSTGTHKINIKLSPKN